MNVNEPWDGGTDDDVWSKGVALLTVFWHERPDLWDQTAMEDAGVACLFDDTNQLRNSQFAAVDAWSEGWFSREFESPTSLAFVAAFGVAVACYNQDHE